LLRRSCALVTADARLGLPPAEGAPAGFDASEVESPRLVVMSSITGHDALSMASLIKELRSSTRSARNALIVAGGLLETGQIPDIEVTRRLLGAGFDAVFLGEGAWEAFDASLPRLPTCASPGPCRDGLSRPEVHPLYAEKRPRPRTLQPWVTSECLPAAGRHGSAEPP
jgi:hypothetical protein